MQKLQLCLCEIRAYPFIPNRYLDQIKPLVSDKIFPVTNALDFVTNVMNDSLAKQPKNINSRYKYDLYSCVHVYATILIGDPSFDFRSTKDWYITSGISSFALINPSYPAYKSNADRFGLETKIDSLSCSVSFIRKTDNAEFNTIYAAVFATTTDCA